MQRGPEGEKRPADGVARAVMVARIATGEGKILVTNIRTRSKAARLGAKPALRN